MLSVRTALLGSGRAVCYSRRTHRIPARITKRSSNARNTVLIALAHRIWPAMAIAALLWGRPGYAQERRQEQRWLSFEYSAPRGCGSQREVERKLHDALGEAPREPVPIQASVSVSAESGGYRLHFRALRGAVRSDRTLLLDGCEAVTEASALLLLLTIDPVLAEDLGADAIVGAAQATEPSAAEPPVAEPASALVSPPATQAAEPAPTSAESRPEARADARAPALLRGAWFGAGLRGTSGIAASSALGAGLEGTLLLGRVAVSLEAAWLSALDSEIPGVSGAALQSSQLRGAVFAGPRWRLGALHLGPYAGVSLDRVSADSRGVSDPGDGATQWLSALGGAAFGVEISKSWSVELRAGAAIPTERPRYRVAELEAPVHRPSAVGAEAALGISWGWGSQSR